MKWALMIPTDKPGIENADHTVMRQANLIRRYAAENIAHYIVVKEGSESGKRQEIGPAPISVGRHADNRFALADPFVSGHHCMITFESGQLWVTDLDSSNGTFIDDQPVQQRTLWPADATLHVGNQMLRQEYHRREDVLRSDELARDLRNAAHYVRTLLPQPLLSGLVTTSWHFEPSAELGGDIFDYFWLDPDHFVFYLLDVSGHGVRAALHSISIFNLLRQQSLQGVDFSRPKQVLKALNDALPMDRYGDMFFTIWYGIYQPRAATVTYASAGHPPALLFYKHGEQRIELFAEDAPIGVASDLEFQEKTIPLYPGGRFCLYSDGVYEITTRNGAVWCWDEFIQLMQEGFRNGAVQPKFICGVIRGLTKADRFEDDFSLVILNF
jgi:serine phosphatase RsbU (regulator of sigma subunit)